MKRGPPKPAFSSYFEFIGSLDKGRASGPLFRACMKQQDQLTLNRKRTYRPIDIGDTVFGTHCRFVVAFWVDDRQSGSSGLQDIPAQLWRRLVPLLGLRVAN
jgi:hypothetical protein